LAPEDGQDIQVKSNQIKSINQSINQAVNNDRPTARNAAVGGYLCACAWEERGTTLDGWNDVWEEISSAFCFGGRFFSIFLFSPFRSVWEGKDRESRRHCGIAPAELI
jgi:hypothetical protein